MQNRSFLFVDWSLRGVSAVKVFAMKGGSKRPKNKQRVRGFNTNISSYASKSASVLARGFAFLSGNAR
jgi:hypothetical protein